MRVAFLSDVHSNLPALEAVLDDIATVGVDARYALGDLVGYAPWPNETLERLRAEGFPIVMGNYDDGTGFDLAECGCAYTNPAREGRRRSSFAWTKAHTSRTPTRPGSGRSLATSASRRTAFASCSSMASPRRINEYLYEDKPDAHVRPDRGGRRRGRDRMRPHPPTVREDRRWNAGSSTIGSAGKPKDGDPRACWALVDSAARSVEFRRVEYDVGRTAEAILASDLPAEFAAQVREGRGLEAVSASAAR